MEIHREQRGTFIILTVSGRLDATTSADLESALMGAYDAGCRHFLIDGPGLNYVSSAGLRILLKVYKHLRPTNGTIALSGLQTHIREIFTLTGFQSLFPMYETKALGLRNYPS